MRGLLVVNPKATTTSPRVTDVIVHALSDELHLHVETTQGADHATELAAQARRDGLDIVVTLGGDGVIHEAVNGLLAEGPGPQVPLLATVPGGSGNVFARALGLPADPVEATGQILEAMRAGRRTAVGLGRVNGTWFIANAGLGIDAQVIEAMERQRQVGHRATPIRYLMTTLSEVFRVSDRHHPRLTVLRPGAQPLANVHLAIVQNTNPWTYLGSWPIEPCPQASFATGLDLFGLHRLDPATIAIAAQRMLIHRATDPVPGRITLWHDIASFEIRADSPTPMQIDGEAVGPVSVAVFESVPDALTVVR